MRVIFTGLIILLIAESLFAEKTFEYNSKGNRDPFVPLISGGGGYISDAYGISGVKDIRLEGIVLDEEKDPIAIVNGEIVREGQEIGSVKIIKIEEDGVIFNADGQDIKIELITD